MPPLTQCNKLKFWDDLINKESMLHHFQPSSQITRAIQDVAEAYCMIPITSNQWPGLVVRLCSADEFAINLCNDFGLTSAEGSA